MDIPTKKLLRLLSEDASPEQKAAAALVVGELGLKDADLATAINKLVSDRNPDVRANAIVAAGRVKLEKSLPELLERIGHGGPEAPLAAEAVVAMGAKGVKALQDIMHKVVPGVRKYIAAALTASMGQGNDAAGLSVLLDRDPNVAASAAQSIIAKIADFDAARRKTLAKELVAIAKNKKKPLPNTSELPVVRVLVALGDPIAADVLWDRVLLPHTPDVRAAALQAVGGWVKTPDKDQLKKLFHCAGEPDFRVAAPALAILEKLPFSEKTADEWIALLHAPDIAARRLAIEKVGDRDSAPVAEALMLQMHHSDPGVRDASRAKLKQLKAGRKLLVHALLETEGHDDAWQLARTVVSFKAELTSASRESILATACKYLEKGDHRTDAMLFVLREIDAAALQEKLLERGIELRKKKKYDAAMTYLKAVARDPSIGFDARLEIALNGLKVSTKEMDPHDRDNDPCLRSFDTLFQQDAERLEKELEKAKFLDDEDLFYVGFHFAEQIGRPRQFGIDVLKMVAKRYPKTEAGKSAKNKLKNVGA
jgi:HEAT repeat protein